MSGIEVLSRTQRIIVLPNTSVSIVKEGPPGPRGPEGLRGPQGLAGDDGADVVDMYVLGSDSTVGDKGVLTLALDEDDVYASLRMDADGNLKVVIDPASLASLETINVSNVAGTEFAEDSAHTNGDDGSLVLAVRRDEDTASVTNDGDYAALLVDGIGRLKIKHIKDNQVVNGSVTIAISGSVTTSGGDTNAGIIDLTKKALVGVSIPAAWTTAGLTFLGSTDGGTTFFDLYDETGTERAVLVVASRTITLEPTKFMGCTHLKIRSGTSATPVAQAAARTLTYTTVAL